MCYDFYLHDISVHSAPPLIKTTYSTECQWSYMRGGLSSWDPGLTYLSWCKGYVPSQGEWSLFMVGEGGGGSRGEHCTCYSHVEHWLESKWTNIWKQFNHGNCRCWTLYQLIFFSFFLLLFSINYTIMYWLLFSHAANLIISSYNTDLLPLQLHDILKNIHNLWFEFQNIGHWLYMHLFYVCPNY